MPTAAQIAANLSAIRQRIADAAQRSGRRGEAVTLVAVTKYVGAAQIRELLDRGCRDLGESRAQDLWAKADAVCDPAVHWHFVGHLQRNKVERTLPLVHLLHSVDSLRLLDALEAAAAPLQRRVPVLLEVHISGDATKHGFQPETMEPALLAAAQCGHLQVCGLMGMAAREGDLRQARDEFRQLRELRDRLRLVAPPTVRLDELSMGMSGDFEVAIEEGATIVRIGSALFV